MPSDLVYAPQLTKLEPIGAAILEEYWAKFPTPTLPPLSDRKELTGKLKELPGYEIFWSDEKTAAWFRRRCRKLRQEQLVSTATKNSYNNALQVLNVLLKEQPNPTPDLIKVWATLLAGNTGNTLPVETWAAFVQQLVDSKAEAAPSLLVHTIHANVDSDIGSRELAEPTVTVAFDKIKCEPDDSLTLPPMPVPVTEEIVQPVESVIRSSPPVDVPGKHMMPPLQVAIREAFETFPDTQDCTPFPSTPDEFGAMFAPYRQNLIRLLCLLESEL